MVRQDPGLQSSLYNVLLAFSSAHPSVGYCQGMNFIAGILLLIFQSESEAFSALTGLFLKFDLEGLFRPGVPDLHKRQFQFAYYTKVYLPDLFAHFKRIGVTTGVFVDKWCMGLFSSFLPVDTLFRVWDVFFLDGWKALVKIGLSTLTELRPLFLSMDLEQLSTYLRDNTRTQHSDYRSLLQTAAKIKVTRAGLVRLNADFLIEQAEHKVEFTERYVDLNSEEKQAIDKAKAEIEKFDPLLKQGVQNYQMDVETLEKEVAVKKGEMDAKAAEVETVERAIEQISEEKMQKVAELRLCEAQLQKNKGTYVSVSSVSPLIFECRPIQPESPGSLSEDIHEADLRASINVLESQLQVLQETHREKVNCMQFDEFAKGEKEWKEMEVRRESKRKQLEGFVQMWEMKRRDIFFRLSRKLRPSLLMK